MVYDLFNVLWILIARILLRIFASMFISDVGQDSSAGKEQKKCPPNQTKEEEIGNLPEKEF